MTGLFATADPPLLLKADNGAPFHAEATTAFLAAMQVQILFSPAYTPRYNGAIEAGNGSLKTRTHHHAALRGRAGAWTCDDVEAARQEANTLAHPFGENGPTPDERWRQRDPITVVERRRFDETIKSKCAEMEREQSTATEGDPGMTKAKRQREAISRALVAEGYLEYTTRRIPSPISLPKAT